MNELAVVTPTFHSDAELFADLHRSVLDNTPPDTVHHVFVPPRDYDLFRGYQGPRCQVRTSSSLLARQAVRVAGMDFFLSARRPWPPVRGWVAQQAVKIAAVSELDASAVLVIDSDVVLVRPVRAERFRLDGKWMLYREDRAVTAALERHVIWHHVARRMLGLPAPPPLPLPDYVSPVNVWRPATVRAMIGHITDATGRPWMDVFTGQRHVSEFMLYGVFVDEVLHARRQPPPTDQRICYPTWQRTPLDHDGAIAFAEGLWPEAIAMMISAKSRTPVRVRRAAIRRCAEIVSAESGRR